MELVDKIEVGGITYAIGLPNGLTDEQQEAIRQNIGAGAATETVNFSVNGQTLVLTKGISATAEEGGENA